MGFNTSAGTMTSGGNALQIGGALTSAVGAYYSSQAQKSALQYQALVADTNANLAEKAAQSTLLQGQQEANRIQLKTAQLEGAQHATMAANGIDLGEGSAARILADTEILGKIDSDTTIANSVRTAYGYRQQETNYQNDAIMKRAGADGISPFGAATSTLLTGAAGVARNWYRPGKGAAAGGINMPDDAPNRGGQ